MIGASRKSFLGMVSERMKETEQRLAGSVVSALMAIRYGAESCPRTTDILGRHGGVIMDPNFTDDDVKDIVRAIRKVYLAMAPA